MTRRRLAWAAGLLLVLGGLLAASGCSSVGYLWQSARGHVQLLHAARPVSDWLDDPATPAPLRERLQLSKRLRDYAVQTLHLPDNDSYRRYADVHRPAAVWNVVAAPELSLTLETWCFPVVGCVGYRGYFDLAEAQAAGEALKAQGLEVSVYPVPAYSTLGWSNWVGGDPLLNTFIGWPEGELARLVFHELAHQVVYAPGDTAFNESFATAVEEVGVQSWLADHASEAARRQYAEIDRRRRDFRALVGRSREALQALYAAPLDAPARRARKAELMQALREAHARLRDDAWGGFAGYDAFIAQANNASLGVQGAYHVWVPAFLALFEREGRDLPRFYAAVRALAALPAAARDAQLRALAVPAAS